MPRVLTSIVNFHRTAETRLDLSHHRSKLINAYPSTWQSFIGRILEQQNPCKIKADPNTRVIDKRCSATCRFIFSTFTMKLTKSKTKISHPKKKPSNKINPNHQVIPFVPLFQVSSIETNIR